MSTAKTQALALLKRGATIGVGPQGAWITERDGTSSTLNLNSFYALRRGKHLRRVEPPGRFYAITHWTFRPPC
jgi:hypothetical protein